MRLFFFSLLLVSVTLLLAQSFTPVVALERNVVFSPEWIRIYNYPDNQYAWGALNPKSFETDTRTRPLEYRMPVSVTAGGRMFTKNKNAWSLLVSYNRYLLVDESGSGLRFTDMIDAREGFVNPSLYSLDEGFFAYSSFGFSVSFLATEEWGSTTHRIGLGLNAEQIVSSSYFLNLTNSRTNEKFDLEAKDITLSDHIKSVRPEFHYQIKVISKKELNLWYTNRFSFNVNTRQNRGPIGHLWQSGLTLEFGKKVEQSN